MMTTEGQKRRALYLLGKLVNFNHLPEGDGMRVLSVTKDYMLTIDRFVGDFAPHLFILKSEHTPEKLNPTIEEMSGLLDGDVAQPSQMAVALRSRDELEAAHDRLVAILLGHVPNPFSDNPQLALTAATEVLCWVLRHDHNRTFQENLDHIDKFLLGRGLHLKKVGA